MNRAAALVAAVALGAGCGGRMGEIVTDTGDLAEATGAPRVTEVVELGGGDVVLTGAGLGAGAGDGAATVGEALWVRGSSFGRQPTVAIGGRPAAVLARTGDGGLAVRVPPTVPPGRQPLLVSNEHGQTEARLEVRRLVAVMAPAGGRIAVAEINGDGPRALSLMEVPAPGQVLRLSGDGRAAYVLDAAVGKLTVLELPAQAGPRVVYSMDLGREPVVGFAAAAAAPWLAVVRARDVVLLRTSSPLHPTRGRARPLPLEVTRAGVGAVALSPDGRVLVIAARTGNRLLLVPVGGEGADDDRPSLAPVAPPLVGEVALAPGARVPVLVDLGFTATVAAAGAGGGRDVLWVALGDTDESRAVGPQPTELLALRLQPAAPGQAPQAAVIRRVPLPNVQRPMRLSTGRAIPLPSGTSIRLPPERAAVYLTAGGAGASGGSTVFRLGAEDRAQPFLELGGDAGGPDLSPDGRWLLVPVLMPGGRLQLVAAPADDRPGQRQTVDLGVVAGAPAVAGAAGRLPVVAAQP